MAKRLAREELYDLVWSEPIVVLATKFGLSDVRLSKICKKADLPVPPRGCWAKKEAGKDVVQAALPHRRPGAADDVVTGTYADYLVTDEEILAPIPPPPVFDESLDKIREVIRARLGKIAVPRTLERPHAAVARLLQQDDERRAKLAESQYSERPYFESRFEEQRLRIVNGFFRRWLAWASSAVLAAKTPTGVPKISWTLMTKATSLPEVQSAQASGMQSRSA